MLGTALASGLQTYSAVSNERRRRQLHDLQVEGATLRNYGMQRENEFYDDTYDNRAGKIGADRRAADYKAEQERVAMEVETLLAPWKVHKGEYDARKAEQSYLTEVQSTRKTGHEADRAATNADIRRRTAESEVAGTNAKFRQEEYKFDREVLEDAQDALAAQFELADGDLARLFNNRGARGVLLGVARATVAPEVDDFDVLDGGVVRVTMRDGEHVDLDAEEFIAGMFDSDSLVEAGQLQAQDVLAKQQVSTAAQQARGEHAAAAANATETLSRLEGVEEGRSSVSQLEGEALRLRGRIHTLEQRKTRGFGSASANAPIEAEIEALNAELEAVGSNLAALQASYGEDALSLSDDELTTLRSTAQATLAGNGEALGRDLNLIGGAAGQARLVSRAEGEDLPIHKATRNALTTGDPAQSTEEQLEAEAERTQHYDTLSDSANSTLDRAFETFEDSVAAQELKSRGIKQDDFARARRSVEAAVARNPEIGKLLQGTPEQRRRIGALLSLALEGSMYSGEDAGSVIDGYIANRNPATIEAGAAFANDEGFKGISYDVRYRAVEMAMQRIESGVSPNRAKAEALQWAEQVSGQAPRERAVSLGDMR